jgi:hypothetical protein
MIITEQCRPDLTRCYAAGIGTVVTFGAVVVDSRSLGQRGAMGVEVVPHGPSSQRLSLLRTSDFSIRNGQRPRLPAVTVAVLPLSYVLPIDSHLRHLAVSSGSSLLPADAPPTLLPVAATVCASLARSVTNKS